MTTLFTIRDTQLELHRFPKRANETLQAWDAGDEYLINHVEDNQLTSPSANKVLILNDNFGALSCWFSNEHDVTMVSDSFISNRGTLKNLQRNQCNRVTLNTSLDQIESGFDLVLIKIPKNKRFLKWQLSQLRQVMSSDTKVIAVDKVKEIHTSTLNIFEQQLGTTTTSLAWKKHRLVFSEVNAITDNVVDEFIEWQVDEHNITLKNRANVYSGESLDLGARLMLQHIPQDPNLRHIIDLGCGNGVLAIKAGQLNPQARLTCVDESFMAVESARQNLIHNLGSERQMQCIANNCLDGFKKNASYLVLCNPPFHQNNAITDHIAWQMFCDAKHVLSNGGELRVIGNRHLGYHAKLARLFGEANVTTVAQDKKFVILSAKREPNNE